MRFKVLRKLFAEPQRTAVWSVKGIRYNDTSNMAAWSAPLKWRHFASSNRPSPSWQGDRRQSPRRGAARQALLQQSGRSVGRSLSGWLVGWLRRRRRRRRSQLCALVIDWSSFDGGGQSVRLERRRSDHAAAVDVAAAMLPDCVDSRRRRVVDVVRLTPTTALLLLATQLLYVQGETTWSCISQSLTAFPRCVPSLMSLSIQFYVEHAVLNGFMQL